MQERNVLTVEKTLSAPCRAETAATAATAASPPHLSIRIGADSHIGMVRRANEDSYVYCRGGKKQPSLAVVGDGIGGHNNGDIASGLLTRMLAVRWRAFLEKTNTPNNENVARFLKLASREINNAVVEINNAYGGAHPMGTTLAGAAFTADSIITAHAGDSRIYRWRRGELEQLTKDHNIVSQLVESGRLSLADAKRHPMAHVITRAIGAVLNIKVDIMTFDLLPGDRYLLCSDGLNLHLSDSDIGIILADAKTASQAANKLIMTALHRGGGDNTTAICAFADNEIQD